MKVFTLICDFCKKLEATNKANINLINLRTRKREKIKIGDACDACMKHLTNSLKEITEVQNAKVEGSHEDGRPVE